MRYPGAKLRMLKHIEPVLGPMLDRAWGYVEPFLGSGAVARMALARLPKGAPATLADKDPWIIAYWRAASQEATALINLVNDFVPSVDAFFDFQKCEKSGILPEDDVKAALQKLALHAMSWGGLGALAGSPIGGVDQAEKKYKVDCRWSKEQLTKEIRQIESLCRERTVELKVSDFTETLLVPSTWVAYVDPPYWAAGPQLYTHFFDDQLHRQLATILNDASYPWVLSYDEDPRVRAAYRTHNITEIGGTTQRGGAAGKPRKKNELLVIKC